MSMMISAPNGVPTCVAAISRPFNPWPHPCLGSVAALACYVALAGCASQTQQRVDSRFGEALQAAKEAQMILSPSRGPESGATGAELDPAFEAYRSGKGAERARRDQLGPQTGSSLGR